MKDKMEKRTLAFLDYPDLQLEEKSTEFIALHTNIDVVMYILSVKWPQKINKNYQKSEISERGAVVDKAEVGKFT